MCSHPFIAGHNLVVCTCVRPSTLQRLSWPRMCLYLSSERAQKTASVVRFPSPANWWYWLWEQEEKNRPMHCSDIKLCSLVTSDIICKTKYKQYWSAAAQPWPLLKENMVWCVVTKIFRKYIYFLFTVGTVQYCRSELFAPLLRHIRCGW